MNWYVGTDWSVIPAGGNSLRQVFVRLEDYETRCQEINDKWALENQALTAEMARVKQEYGIYVNVSEDEDKTVRARIAALEAIIARNDTTESFKCTECGAWHVRKVEAK